MVTIYRCSRCGDPDVAGGTPCPRGGVHSVVGISVDLSKAHATAATLNADEVFELLSAFVNVMGNERQLEQAVRYQLPRMHRTLQQNLMRALIAPAVETLATDEYPDARNEASVGVAKAWVGASGPPYALPFI